MGNVEMTLESTDRSMQFILRRAVDEAVLIPVLQRILGFGLESVDGPPRTAEAVYWIERYSQGFAMGVLLGWNARVRPSMGHVDAALRLARFTEDTVVTDLPENHPEYAVPSMWCMVEPDGRLFAVSEDDAYDLSRGLVLFESSRRLLS